MMSPSGRPAPCVIHPPHVCPRSSIRRLRESAPVMHTTLLATDIIGFGNCYRDASAQLYIRQVMYELLIEAFDITGLSWWDCYREDRGDGALVVATPDANPDRFLDPLMNHLHALLGCYARRADDSRQLRLRMAVHYGCVYHDPYGVTGHAVTHLHRLLEAPAFKRAVTTAEGRFGAVVSDWLYTETLQHGGLIDRAAYRQLRLSCKETRTRAWLWLPAESPGR
jgi:hypothetical protein